MALLDLKVERPCGVYDSSLKVRTPRTGCYLYPGVSVYRGRPKQFASDVATNPRVIVEVLSPSTAAYDRGKKFDLYREIPSLQEYVLCRQDSICVQHYARHTDGSWIFREYLGNDAAINLDSIDCTIKLADLYADIPVDESE